MREHYEPGALASVRLGVQSAYALAHEIAHILEGVNRHSETGIMKAHWDQYDRQLISTNSLHFADEDLRMIHAWTERHNRNLMAGSR